MTAPATRMDPFLPIYILLGLVIVIGAFHVIFPRYDVRTTSADGRVIVVVDRWTGKIQRAAYSDTGKIQLDDVLTVF
jgi:hypothetical protein